MSYKYRIVNATAINSMNGLAAVRGELYSGIALEKTEDIFFKAKFYKDGNNVPNWFSDYNIPDDRLWVNTCNDVYETDSEGHPLIDNKPFYGVAFEETDGFIQELVFVSDKHSGLFNLEINEQGEINYLYVSGDNSRLEQVKNDSGFLEKIEFSYQASKSLLYIEGGVNNRGRIRLRGNINSDFIDALHNNLNAYQLDIKYPSTYEKISVEESIKSKLVSVEKLVDVLGCFGFAGAEEVEIESSSLTQTEIFMILNICKPKKLTFNCKTGTIPGSLTEAIKQSYPNLSVNVIST